MNKLILILLLCCMASCSTMVNIASNEPEVQIVIDDVNYGTPPVVYKVPRKMAYFDVSLVRYGITIHQERVYLKSKQNYYEIDLPKGLKKSQSTSKFHSTN